MMNSKSKLFTSLKKFVSFPKKAIKKINVISKRGNAIIINGKTVKTVDDFRKATLSYAGKLGEDFKQICTQQSETYKKNIQQLCKDYPEDTFKDIFEKYSKPINQLVEQVKYKEVILNPQKSYQSAEESFSKCGDSNDKQKDASLDLLKKFKQEPNFFTEFLSNVRKNPKCYDNEYSTSDVKLCANFLALAGDNYLKHENKVRSLYFNLTEKLCKELRDNMSNSAAHS